jgi:hypothetical protein
MAVVYFLIVLPYKAAMARQGKGVFGDPPPTKTCPACLSDEPSRDEVQALRLGHRPRRDLTVCTDCEASVSPFFCARA